MGSHMSKEVQAVSTAVANVAFTSVTKNETTCKTTTVVNQDQSLTITGSHNSVTGVDQTSTIQINANCQVSAATNQQMQSDITSMLQSQVADNSSALGDTLKSLVTAFGGDSKSTVSSQSTISTQVNQLFTTTNTNTMINSYLVNQNQAISISGSYNDVSNVTQALQLNALISMASNNTTVTKALATVSQDAQSNASSVSTDPIQEIFSGIGQVISSFSGNWALIAGGGLCSCCCCIIVIAVVFMMMSSQSPAPA